MSLAYGTLVPFWPPGYWEHLPDTWREALTMKLGNIEPRNTAEHFLSFVLPGLLLHWTLVTHRARRRRFLEPRPGLSEPRPSGSGPQTDAPLRHTPTTRHGRFPDLLLSLILISALAVVLELGQNIVPARHGRWSDALCGFAGGAAGALVGMGLRRFDHAIWILYAKRERLLTTLIIILGNLTAAAMLIRAHTGATLDNWNCDYPLLIANEGTVDRPWRGKIEGVAIYDQALDPERIAALARTPFSKDGHTIRSASDPLLVYTFNKRPIRRIEPAFARNAPLDLRPNWTERLRLLPDAGGWEILGSVLLESVGPADAVCYAIHASQAFTLEVKCAMANLDRGGPARIVSISRDPYRRNVTIAQLFTELDVRVRTPRTGPNGILLPMTTRDDTLAGGWHHIAVTYDNGTIRVFIDGAEAIDKTVIHSPATMLLRREFPGARVLAATLLFLPLALAAGIRFAAAPFPHHLLYGACAAALMPVAAFTATTVAFARQHDMPFVAAAIAVTVVGITIGRLTATTKSASPSSQSRDHVQ